MQILYYCSHCLFRLNMIKYNKFNNGGNKVKNELILILDFGGQYNQLIARRVRECNVYSEVVPYNISIEKIKQKNPKGIIFTGGPASVFGDDSPKCAKRDFRFRNSCFRNLLWYATYDLYTRWKSS